MNNATSTTLPTLAYRAGDFSRALTGRNAVTDGLGRPVPENGVYDPLTDRVEKDGLRYRNLFPGNIVPLTRMDTVAQRIQALIPLPTTTGPGMIGRSVLWTRRAAGSPSRTPGSPPSSATPRIPSAIASPTCPAWPSLL